MNKKTEFHTRSQNVRLVERRRKFVVKRTLKILTKNGFHHTTVREITEACNMNVGTLYHYFGSKEEILLYIIEQATTAQFYFLKKYKNIAVCMNPRETLLSLYSDLLEWHEENSDLTIFMYQELKILPKVFRDAIFESEGRILSLFEGVLLRGQELGEFNLYNHKLVAHNLILTAHNWALRRWFLRKYFTKQEYENAQAEILLRTIGGKK
jgi:AcrR family transcriptional regulator